LLCPKATIIFCKFIDDDFTENESLTVRYLIDQLEFYFFVMFSLNTLFRI